MTDENTSKPEEEAPAAAPPPPAEETVIEPETLPAGGTVPSVGKRILAVLIDGLIAGVCGVVPAVGPVLAIAYMITRDALPFLEGQSIGKKAMKLRAVSEETGKPLTNDWGPAIIRSIVLYIPFFPIVELIVMGQNPEQQRLGDKWAKTKVIAEA